MLRRSIGVEFSLMIFPMSFVGFFYEYSMRIMHAHDGFDIHFKIFQYLVKCKMLRCNYRGIATPLNRSSSRNHELIQSTLFTNHVTAFVSPQQWYFKGTRCSSCILTSCCMMYLLKTIGRVGWSSQWWFIWLLTNQETCSVEEWGWS